MWRDERGSYWRIIFGALFPVQTGLDPEVRRLIWEIINRQRQGKTIILTTHSMEEAEVLCQNIGIMAKGQLRCLGVRFSLEVAGRAKLHRRD